MYRQFYGHTLSAYFDCKTALDDVKHYLFECRSLYKLERDELIDSINSITFFPPNLNELLTNLLFFTD